MSDTSKNLDFSPPPLHMALCMSHAHPYMHLLHALPYVCLTHTLHAPYTHLTCTLCMTCKFMILKAPHHSQSDYWYLKTSLT